MTGKTLTTLATFLCLVLVLLSAAGCAPQATPTTAPTAAPTAVPTEGPTPTPEAPDFSAPIKFSYATLYPFDTADDWYKTEIAARFNVEVEFLQMGWDNYQEKESAWFASGDMPDTMMKTSFKYAEYVKLADQGVLREIPAFGEKYPNLQRIADRLTVLDKITLDGKLYAWPRSKMFVDDPVQNTTMAFWARKDWLEAVGHDKDVYTLEEFIAACKAIVAQDPGQAGTSLVPFNTGLYMPAIFGPGLYNPNYNAYVKVDGQYEWGARLPETLEGIRFMKRLYDEGVLSRDFYTQKSDTATGQFMSGQCAFYYENSTPAHINGFFAPDQSGLVEKWGVGGPEGFTLVQVLNPEGKLNLTQESEYWAAFVFSPRVDDAKMERMMYIMDWLVSEEGTRTATLGIQGVDWKMNGDEVELLWKKDENDNLVAPAYNASWMRMWVTNGGDELKFNPGIFEDTLAEVQHLFDVQMATPQENFLIDYDLAFFSAPTYDKFGSYSKEVDDQIIKMVISSTDLDKDWADWLDSMKDKVDPILAEINAELAG